MGKQIGTFYYSHRSMLFSYQLLPQQTGDGTLLSTSINVDLVRHFLFFC